MRAIRGLGLIVVVLSSSCVYGSRSPLTGTAASLALSLRPFSGCEELLDYVHGHALEQVTPWGLPGTGGFWSRGIGDVAVAEAAADGAAAAPAPGPVAGEDFSTTNVQTEGVDEPDIVKTDGRRLLVLSGQGLVVIDVSAGAPRRTGSVRLGDVWARDMLVHGDRALVLGELVGGPVPEPLAGAPEQGFGGPISALVEVDLSDPADPQVVRRLLVDGGYLSARMIEGVARVVVSSYPTGLEFEYPEGPGLRAEREALERNREVIRASGIESWVPYFVLEDGAGSVEAEGSLLDCASAHHPPAFSGLGMLTVVTVDLSEGLGPVEDLSVGVLADGETVYASGESLYVATQRWVDPLILERGANDDLRDEYATLIHRFDIAGSDRAEYRASGEVPGWLLNQFSMDEHDGHLRVASTDAPPFFDGPSESMVTILAERDGRLAEVGRVGGLGVGERIFAVRFLGDLGYVVTFRQVDPLYVVDLSVEERPAVVGELKIPGYSAYLHPAGDGLLLGVGQDATTQGRLQGTQMSLFDISDPSSPQQVDVVRIEDGSSEVEWDHHAFLYWEPTGLIVMPLNVYPWEDGPEAQPFSGAVAVRLAGVDLQELGRLSHEHDASSAWGPGIRRSLVVGDLLYTVSDTSVEAVDLQTLEEAARIPLG